MRNEKSDKKVKQIIENYKKNLASLMRKGQAGDVISLLHDSGVIGLQDTNMYEIAKISINATCVEEIEVQRVNFIFSLLTKVEKEIILNEFILSKSPVWWHERFSRSSYYRYRRKACNKFVEYLGTEKK